MLIIELILVFFGLMAWFFQKASPKNEKIERLSRKCPCTRMANTGVLTKIFLYSAIGIIIINASMLDYVGFNKDNISQFIIALVLVFLGYKVRKDEYDRN
ncbi:MULTISPECIES: hypothetical protein [unclassified Campylobacter]|uniref:hypothetical protein n=1 Tax=unclassified Campylobacter TaxID=2593542 RepID=UPI001BDAD50A|nr:MULTISPECIES: hypothetical protein [unclassified Campylobacter]MBT0880205.1 hypothetical protein [Campylobacter sp. 2018MI27]MBT0883978.1 hypothetical protein [Campylobacter sp. 2018MI10]